MKLKFTIILSFIILLPKLVYSTINASSVPCNLANSSHCRNTPGKSNWLFIIDDSMLDENMINDSRTKFLDEFVKRLIDPTISNFRICNRVDKEENDCQWVDVVHSKDDYFAAENSRSLRTDNLCWAYRESRDQLSSRYTLPSRHQEPPDQMGKFFVANKYISECRQNDRRTLLICIFTMQWLFNGEIPANEFAEIASLENYFKQWMLEPWQDGQRQHHKLHIYSIYTDYGIDLQDNLYTQWHTMNNFHVHGTFKISTPSQSATLTDDDLKGIREISSCLCYWSLRCPMIEDNRTKCHYQHGGQSGEVCASNVSRHTNMPHEGIQLLAYLHSWCGLHDRPVVPCVSRIECDADCALNVWGPWGQCIYDSTYDRSLVTRHRQRSPLSLSDFTTSSCSETETRPCGQQTSSTKARVTSKSVPHSSPKTDAYTNTSKTGSTKAGESDVDKQSEKLLQYGLILVATAVMILFMCVAIIIAIRRRKQRRLIVNVATMMQSPPNYESPTAAPLRKSGPHHKVHGHEHEQPIKKHVPRSGPPHKVHGFEPLEKHSPKDRKSPESPPKPKVESAFGERYLRLATNIQQPTVIGGKNVEVKKHSPPAVHYLLETDVHASPGMQRKYGKQPKKHY